jgi:hypothetical protein
LSEQKHMLQKNTALSESMFKPQRWPSQDKYTMYVPTSSGTVQTSMYTFQTSCTGGVIFYISWIKTQTRLLSGIDDQ